MINPAIVFICGGIGNICRIRMAIYTTIASTSRPISRCTSGNVVTAASKVFTPTKRPGKQSRS